MPNPHSPKLRLAAALALLLGLALAAGPARADELPPDRVPLGAPPVRSGQDGSEPLVLPPAPDPAADPGRTDWATTDAATIRRESHLRRTAAAFGAAGTFTGFAVTCVLVAQNQPDPAHRRGWYTGAAVLGGLSGVALVTGTVLWATTPEAPGTARLAAGPGGVTLTLRF